MMVPEPDYEMLTAAKVDACWSLREAMEAEMNGHRLAAYRAKVPAPQAWLKPPQRAKKFKPSPIKSRPNNVVAMTRKETG